MADPMVDLGGPVLAIDVGGTKLATALVRADGAIVARRSIPTPATSSGEELFSSLVVLAREVVGHSADRGRDLPPDVCGVGCGGPMTPGGEEVSPLNIPAWRRFPLRARLADELGLPTFVDNDAKALALGEGWLGAARGCDDFLAMVVSTGVGGGIVLDGRLLDGAQGNAGHIGHVVVEPDGRPCPCGSRGCLEAEASGPAIEAITGRPPAAADAASLPRS